jgi:hypothetical protein
LGREGGKAGIAQSEEKGGGGLGELKIECILTTPGFKAKLRYRRRVST